jgi:hypothetical protein
MAANKKDKEKTKTENKLVDRERYRKIKNLF